MLLTCLRSSVMVTQLNCRPLAIVGLCHQLFEPSMACVIGWWSKRSALFSSHTPHWILSSGCRLTCSDKRQYSSDSPSCPQVALLLMSARVARLNTTGKRPLSGKHKFYSITLQTKTQGMMNSSEMCTIYCHSLLNSSSQHHLSWEFSVGILKAPKILGDGFVVLCQKCKPTSVGLTRPAWAFTFVIQVMVSLILEKNSPVSTVRGDHSRFINSPAAMHLHWSLLCHTLYTTHADDDKQCQQYPHYIQLCCPHPHLAVLFSGQ